MPAQRIIVAITGASGSIYGLRLIEALLTDPRREVHVIVSPAGARVMAAETDLRPALAPFDPRSFLRLTDDQAARIHHHAFADIGAGPASGTFRHDGMVICPASVKTVGAVAAGLADNLIARAADVAIKEGLPLVLVPRETPLSSIHLRNLLTISQAGGIVLPANPAFYHRPQTIEDLVRYVTQKIFDRLGLELPDSIRWGEKG
jgi:4-hydroxy-3-polyprenylbenzoate decarboxylase